MHGGYFSFCTPHTTESRWVTVTARCWQFATALGLVTPGLTWDKGQLCRCGVTGLFGSYLNHSVSDLNSANNRPGWEYLKDPQPNFTFHDELPIHGQGYG